MDKIRTYPPEKITPSSVIGDCIEIFSRHFYFPFKRIMLVNKEKEECNIILYTGKAKDNSSATIKTITSLDCLKTKFTYTNLNSKISGTQIDIQTKIKARDRDIKKIKLTGRHNAQKLHLNDFTYVELMKEESNIINSQDYHLLLEKKEKLELNADGLIEISK